jgi:hypothetical protein
VKLNVFSTLRRDDETFNTKNVITDFTSRIKIGAPLNNADPATYYGGGVEGYTDYPEMK